MAYRIRPSRPPAGEVRRIAREQLRLALACLEDAERDPANAARPIQRVRVACKRLRSLLRLVEGPMGESFGVEDARLSGAADALARARDAQVMLDAFDSLADDLRENPGVREIRATLDARRDLEAVAGADSGPAITRARALLRATLADIDSWPIDRLTGADLWEAHRATYRRARRHLRRTLADPTSDSSHAWRRWAKRHWHQVRLLRSADPKALRRRAEALDRLTNRLGRRHDLDLLGATLPELSPAPDPDAARLVAARIEKLGAALMFRSLRDGLRLFSDSPKAMSRRLEKAWTRGRSA